MRHLAANAMTVVIVIGIAVAGLALWGVKEFSAPGPLSEPTRFVVERGATLGQASRALAAAGVISGEEIFRIGARYRGQATGLKAGEYEIPAGASMEEVLDIVTSGQSIQYRVTVAEGLSSWEVVQVLNASDVLTGEINAIPPEGWLAPDTYFVANGTDRGELINRMLTAQRRIVSEAWAGRAEGLPLQSPEEALILASIVEKETGQAGERGKVAGVFINRLNRGMRLQSDPTIIYGLTNGQGGLGRGIRRSEILKPTPYNTYVIDRLPPAPIANPGRAAIEAVLNPEETTAIYFVADGTGGHAFADTLREHERNVAVWRRIERERNSQ